MTVYIVLELDIDDRWYVAAVFSTKETANAFIEGRIAEVHHDNLYVEEMVIDHWG